MSINNVAKIYVFLDTPGILRYSKVVSRAHFESTLNVVVQYGTKLSGSSTIVNLTDHPTCVAIYVTAYSTEKYFIFNSIYNDLKHEQGVTLK